MVRLPSSFMLDSFTAISLADVCIRVAEIQRLVPKAHWHYIDTKQNPADIATREISFNDFKDSDL